MIADNLAPNLGPVIRIGSDFLVVFSLKLDAPGERGWHGVSAQHFRFDGNLRRAKSCSVGRDATDKLGVVNCDHGRYDAAEAFAEEVGFWDCKIIQQADHVFGVLLEGNRALRDIRSVTMALEIDRND